MKKRDTGQEQSFFKRHFNAVAMGAIVLIPTIYTTFFLGSMWDPYGNISNLPVAFVNTDVPVEYNGKTLDIGGELTEQLKENNQLDFHFVNAEDAEKGLTDGTYYMTITIPQDFSHNASTLLDDNPQKMQLQYSTNPGTNYIASKMSETALSKVERQISESVTKEYAEVIFSQLGEIGAGMTDASDGASAIHDGTEQLADGNIVISENLQLLSESTLTFSDGAETLSNSLKTYTDGVKTVDAGAKSLSDGISQLADGADSLTDGTEKLQNGASSLASGISNYTDGVKSAYAGAIQLTDNNSVISGSADSLSNGAEQIEQGSIAMKTGLELLSSSLGDSLSDENMKQLEQLNAGLTQLQQGISELNTAVSMAELPDTDVLVQALTQSLTKIGADAQDAGNQLYTLNASISAMTQTDAFQSLEPAVQQELLGCFSEPLNAVSTDISDIGNEVTALSDIMQNVDLSGTANLMAQLKASTKILKDGADTAIPATQQTINSLSGGLKSVKQSVDLQLIPASISIADGTKQLADGSSALSDGIKSYTDGVSAVAGGLGILNENSSALNGGAKELKSGISTLADNIPALTDGVSQLQTGAVKLKDGTGKLVANNNALCDGAEQLADGALQIHDGADKLADGSEKLGDGIAELSGGATELQTALSDGADEINSINATDMTYDMLAVPVESSEIYATKVNTNGDAMSAYMMAVGLWVAGLALCIILSPHEQKIKGRNAKKAWIQQIGKLWGLAIVQAVIMVCSLMLFNGFSPDSTMKVIIVACISSIAFLTLEYCINFFMGIIGSFVLLIFMVLQLSGCAGTYPKELSSGFYQAINPLMPFSYTVHGFRSGIASGLDITSDCIVLAVIAIVFAFLLLIGFRKRISRQSTENDVCEFPKDSDEKLQIA